MRIQTFKLMKEKAKRNKTILFYILLFSFIAALALTLTLNRRLSPVAENLLKTKLDGKINETVYRELNALMPSISTENMIFLEKNASGDIRAVVVNSNVANGIKMTMTEEAAAAIRNFKNTELDIPVGTLYGGTFFSGKGKNIKIKSVNVTSVSSEIENKLTSAGINQVLCEAYLNINVSVTAQLAKAKIDTSVTVKLLLSQILSVGTVPDHYTVIETLDEDMIRWLAGYEK